MQYAATGIQTFKFTEAWGTPFLAKLKKGRER